MILRWESGRNRATAICPHPSMKQWCLFLRKCHLKKNAKPTRPVFFSVGPSYSRMTGLKETQVISNPNATFTGGESKAQRGKGPVQVTQQRRGQAKDRGTLLLGSTTHTKSQSSTNQPQTNEVKSHSAHTPRLAL